jgi:hypothetical protein
VAIRVTSKSDSGASTCRCSVGSLAVRKIVAVVSTCVSIFFLSPDLARSQNFQIGKISVCYNNLTDKSSSCSEVASPFIDLDRSKFANSRLYVSLAIICGPDAVTFLKANGFLPVNVAVWKDGTRKSDIPVGILQDDWDANATSLTGLFNDQGSFPWRTRFNVNVYGIKSVDLEVTDAQKGVAYVGREPARLKISFAN